jgi:hypothetical protein
LIIVWGIIAPLTLIASNAVASFSLHSSDRVIKGFHSELGIQFSAKEIKEKIIRLDFQWNGKRLIAWIGTEKDKPFIYINSYYTGSREVVKSTYKDSIILKELLAQLLKQNIVNHGPGKMLVRTLNLLYSWPIGQPVYVLVVNESINSNMETGGGEKLDNAYVSSGPCGWPPTFDLSENICHLINQENEGEFIALGLPTRYFWFDSPLLPVIFPLICGPIIEEVGPFPFDGGDCFGRCGKGCIGDGPPNNDLNIFTQNCFNHDGCVESLGLFHPFCNQMFLYAIKDFLFGEDCLLYQ